MNRSALSDFNRRRSLFDSPNLVRFINRTLHTNTKTESHFDSTTTSSSGQYSSYKPISNPRLAVTRKLSNMNEQSPLQLNRGITITSCFFSSSYSNLILFCIQVLFN